MVLLQLRDTDTIVEFTTPDANKLLRQGKATLIKSTNLVSIFITKKCNELDTKWEVGEAKTTFGRAKILESKEVAVITEWLSKEEKTKLKKQIKKENKEKELIKNL